MRDPFAVSLAVPKKLDSKLAVFTPADNGHFHSQRGSLLGHRNLQREIGAFIQRNVATHSATRGREIEQGAFPGEGIALDIGRIADGNAVATS